MRKIRKISTMMLCVVMIVTVIAVAVPANASESVTIDIDPDTMNLKSKGKWITAYIEWPEGDVNNIDISTVILSVGGGEVQAEESPTSVGDHDNDGVPDLMVKFPRSEVYNLLDLDPPENVVTISWMIDGSPISGQDTVTAIERGQDHTNEADPSSIET